METAGLRAVNFSYVVADGGWYYDSSYHDRPRVAGGYVAVCFAGGIALSRLRVV